jgi:predicted phage tail protein
MPPVIAFLAVVYATIEASAIASFLLSIGASIVLGQISKMLVKKPSSSSVESQVASRSAISRQADEPFED